MSQNTGLEHELSRTSKKHNNQLERKVTLAFRSSVQEERVSAYPKEKIVYEFLDGPMDGTKTVSLADKGDKVELKVTWDIRFRGFLKLVSPLMKRHIRKGTLGAMKRIEEAAISTQRAA